MRRLGVPVATLPSRSFGSVLWAAGGGDAPAADMLELAVEAGEGPTGVEEVARCAGDIALPDARVVEASRCNRWTHVLMAGADC